MADTVKPPSAALLREQRLSRPKPPSIEHYRENRIAEIARERNRIEADRESRLAANQQRLEQNRREDRAGNIGGTVVDVINQAEPKGNFAQEHRYAVATGLILIGIVGIYGSITGSLAPMLAALFAPSYLATTKTAGSGEGVLGSLGDLVSAGTSQGGNPVTNIINDVTTVGKGIFDTFTSIIPGS